MPDGKKLFTYVEVDDTTPVQKLSFIDQVRVLWRHLTEDPANELKTEEAFTTEYMQLKADLTELLLKATKPIRAGKHKSVLLSVDSKFSYVLQDVLLTPEIYKYFIASVAKPKIEYDVPCNLLVKLELRE